MDSFLVSASAGDYYLTADTVGGQTVTAAACNCTGSVFAQTDGVRGRGNISGSVKTLLHSGNHLVHTCHYDDMIRSENERGYSVAEAVDVYQLTVEGDSVGAHKEVVRLKGKSIEFLLLLGGGVECSVINGVFSAFLKGGGNTALLYGFTAAPGDGAALGHK